MVNTVASRLLLTDRQLCSRLVEAKRFRRWPREGQTHGIRERTRRESGGTRF